LKTTTRPSVVRPSKVDLSICTRGRFPSPHSLVSQRGSQCGLWISD